MRSWPTLFFMMLLCLAFIAGYSWSEGVNLYWSFQQPTYLLEKDNLALTTYNCDNSQTACKVNFDFTASLPKDEPSSHFSCTIDFGF